MFVSIYYKPSLFNAHTMILIVHIFMNANKLCLNQEVEVENMLETGFKYGHVCMALACTTLAVVMFSHTRPCTNLAVVMFSHIRPALS